MALRNVVKNDMEFLGKKSREVTVFDEKLKIFTEEFGKTVDILPNVDNLAGMNGHEANLRHFADVLLNGAEPIFVPQQGINMIKILTAMYKSAEEGREIALD